MKNLYIAKGALARTLTDYEVVVTPGADKGVKVGDIAFVVKTYPVDDPITGEGLGDAQLTLARLIVSDVRERFSVARTVASVSAGSELPYSIANMGQRSRQRVTTDIHLADGERVILLSVGDDVIINRVEKDENEDPF